MDRVYQSHAIETPPSAIASSGSYPTAGDKQTGQSATVPGPYWFYSVTEEIRNAIASCGITPDSGKVNQLALALGKFVRSVNGSNPNSDGRVSIDVGVKTVNGRTGDVTGFVTKVNGVSPGADGSAVIGGTPFMPNYKAGVAKSWNSTITAEADGEVIAFSISGASEGIQVQVNGVSLPFSDLAHNGRMSVTFFVAKGDSYKVFGGNNDGSGKITFYPLRGV